MMERTIDLNVSKQKEFKRLKKVPSAVKVAVDSIIEVVKVPKNISESSLRGWLEVTLLALFERGRLDMWES